MYLEVCWQSPKSGLSKAPYTSVIRPQGVGRRPNITAPVRPLSLGSGGKGFVSTQKNDKHNIIVNNKPGLLIQLKSFEEEDP